MMYEIHRGTPYLHCGTLCNIYLLVSQCYTVVARCHTVYKKEADEIYN